jgi:hypothetical protein
MGVMHQISSLFCSSLQVYVDANVISRNSNDLQAADGHLDFSPERTGHIDDFSDVLNVQFLFPSTTRSFNILFPLKRVCS